jgi:OTU domain-containing protein 6
METPHQMKQRHKAELKALTESAGKKKKGSAKELKQKEDDLKKKHEDELRGLQAPSEPAAQERKLSVKEEDDDDDAATGATESKTSSTESRSARKKKAKAAKEQERQAQVAAEVASMKNPRKEEKEKLEAQLKSLGLAVMDVPADGHCLYSSIADQLVATKHPAASQLVKKGDSEPATALRGLASTYMLAHQKDFIGFVTDDEGEPVTQAKYQEYCKNITQPDPVVWGGEPEIVALAKALGSPITVHAAATPPLVISSEQPGTPLQISLHRFELSAGNHYNSVVKVK